MLEIQALSFGYSKQQLFNKISLSQKKGEILGLVGPSGSGKSTLFKILTGLIGSYEGTISINGLSPRDARRYLTYMTQNELLLPWRNVRDNLLLISELNSKKLFQTKKTNEEMFQRAARLLEEVGLSGYEHYFPYQLSGGMRQRVCLARALFLARPFLLLDEPFGQLDRKRRHEMYLLLKGIKLKYNLTILFITHDVFDLYELSDRVLLLDEGNISEVSLNSDMTPECKALIFGQSVVSCNNLQKKQNSYIV
jgi:NitT/TauT family transport system ATP-binding protein